MGLLGERGQRGQIGDECVHRRGIGSDGHGGFHRLGHAAIVAPGYRSIIRI